MKDCVHVKYILSLTTTNENHRELLQAAIIEPCWRLSPWARAAHHQATVVGVKLHTMLDMQSNIPVFAAVSAANMNEMRILDELLFELRAFYMMD